MSLLRAECCSPGATAGAGLGAKPPGSPSPCGLRAAALLPEEGDFWSHVRGSPGTRLRFPLPLSALPPAIHSSPPSPLPCRLSPPPPAMPQLPVSGAQHPAASTNASGPGKSRLRVPRQGRPFGLGQARFAATLSLPLPQKVLPDLRARAGGPHAWGTSSWSSGLCPGPVPVSPGAPPALPPCR